MTPRQQPRTRTMTSGDVRAIGQDHGQAENLLTTVNPDGRELAKKLSRVLAEKSNAHYGTTYLSGAETLSMIRSSRALVDALDAHLN